jgi:hypothetical protein
MCVIKAHQFKIILKIGARSPRNLVMFYLNPGIVGKFLGLNLKATSKQKPANLIPHPSRRQS